MKNKSGLQPIEYKVLVLPDILSDETLGGILKPGRVKDLEQAAAVRGYLVAKGGKACGDFGEPTPKIGDRVQYAKYSGVHEVPGADGKSYILCNDKDIAAIIEDEELVVTRDGNYKFNPEKATYEREE